MDRAIARSLGSALVETLEARRLLSSNLVADVNGILPADAVQVGNYSYFVADDGRHGAELFKSDGTIDGTSMVKDLTAGKAGSQILHLEEVGGQLVFVKADSDGLALYRSDGTASGTSRFALLGKKYADTYGAGVVDGRLVFFVNVKTTGSHHAVQLWSTDGTTVGTTKIGTLITDSNDVRQFSVSNDGHRFIVKASGKLFSSDGTAGNLVDLTAALNVSMSVWDMSFLNGDAVFFDSTGTLRFSDGTVGGTRTLTTVDPMKIAEDMSGGGSHAFYVLNDSVTQHPALWSTDGTVNGTIKIADLPNSFAAHPTMIGDTLYMAVNKTDASHGIQIWKSDGTANGTTLVKTLPSQWIMFSQKFVGVGADGVAYFAVDDMAGHVQLWATNGSSAGTKLVKDYSAPNRYVDNLTLTDLGSELGVTIDGKTEVFDPSSMVAPIGPTQGSVRLESDGTLYIFGTYGDDNIRLYRVRQDTSRLLVYVNGQRFTFQTTAVKRIRIYSYSGDDNIAVHEEFGRIGQGTAIRSGSGNDIIHTGFGKDRIFGEGGDDTIYSNASDDTLLGGTGNDNLIGGGGSDQVSGGRGQNHLDGGVGTDVIFGQNVIEIFYNGQQGSDDADLNELILG